MILESAPLQIRTGQYEAFELAFREAQGIIALLHHYYDPFPTVLHYESVVGCSARSQL